MAEEQLISFIVTLTDRKCGMWDVKSATHPDGREFIGGDYISLARNLIDAGIQRLTDDAKRDAVMNMLRNRN